jgi:hypothetical protein
MVRGRIDRAPHTQPASPVLAAGTATVTGDGVLSQDIPDGSEGGLGSAIGGRGAHVGRMLDESPDSLGRSGMDTG